MAIYHWDVIQRSERWQQLRAGIPTASCFKRIVTPKKCELSKGSEEYIDELLAEWMNGGPLLGDEEVTSMWVDRGVALESQAREAYEFITEREVKLCGFITTDDGMIGASPDGLVNGDSVLELKCPKPTTHARYMRARKVEDDYYPQLQGLLYVCERERIDIESYCPPFPPVIVQVYRDEKYIGLLKTALEAFIETLLKAREFMAQEYGPVIQRMRQYQAPAPEANGAAFDTFCRPVV